MRILNCLLAIFPAAEHRNIIHRAGTIQRNKCDNVAEVCRLYGRQRAAHAFGFQLEHAHCVATLQQLIHFCVVMGQQVEVYVHPSFCKHFGCFLQDRKCFQPQEVEFYQSCAFDIFHVELRDGHVGSWITVERRKFRKLAITDDYTRRMCRTVARKSFQLHGKIEQSFDLFIATIFFA